MSEQDKGKQQVNEDDDFDIVETQVSNLTLDDDDDDPGEEHLDGDRSTSINDDEREQLREKRRQEKKERQERRKKAIDRDKIELNFLRQRNDELERKFSEIDLRLQRSEVSSLDQRIAGLQHQLKMADQVIAKAIDAKNGDDVVKATGIRDKLRDDINRLTHIRETHAQGSQIRDNQQQQRIVQPERPMVSPTVVKHAQKFVEEHTWYNPKGTDEASAIVLAIDTALTQEGYDPTTDDYWDELRDRVKERLPEKFTQQQQRRDQGNGGGGPQLGSGRSGGGSGGRKEVYISPERKKALIDAGVWDDPVLRKKYVKRYMEYDRLNKK